MEAEITDLKLFHELEGRMDARLGALHIVALLIPGTEDGDAAEGIRSPVGEGMPPTHCKAQVVFHFLAGDDFCGIIIFERERIFALGAFILDLPDLFKIGHDCMCSFGKFR
ncbi:hypothetical protein SDC9_180850 [bioreactor metagenome]|uniref:Uncharacterized protein n=1 Tax=bioreactor metagenome TaxID=1076179 RepID=A0A645HB88_9ZZZZ